MDAGVVETAKDAGKAIKDTAEDVGNAIKQAGKDGIGALNRAVNGANVVQISSMGLFMTVLAIFNR